MRDLLVVGIVLIGSLYALRYPWFGIMLWTWVSLMNPHALAYGFARDFPVAAIVAIATLIGVLTTKERQNPFAQSPAVWLLLFMGWICITYPFSYNVEGSTEMFSKVMKVDLMILVALTLLKTRRHIEFFVWVVVCSLGFYGVKGGIFTIMTGGNYRVWGPGGFIGGNNEIALALIVVIPLMRYLQLQATNRWVRHGFTAAMLLSAAAALGSHSRGALLAIAAMAVYLWLKSPKKWGLACFCRSRAYCWSSSCPKTGRIGCIRSARTRRMLRRWGASTPGGLPSTSPGHTSPGPVSTCIRR
ncbi:MAG: putative O-glycosylation ligase, exosortase A system-associated [Candidatus Accumulibacter sp.]|nr:putative O-glycosylation ligase, exosortase A system-associated [Candidatus Accumulibacter propinquus]